MDEQKVIGWRSTIRRGGPGAGLALLLAVAPSAHGACTISKVAELPVKLEANRAFIESEVNGKPLKILVDTGSTFTFIMEEAANELGLKADGVRTARVFGAGGEAVYRATVIKEIKFGQFADKNLQLAVVGSGSKRHRGEAALVLGEDFFSNFTTEFDFPHGVIRLLRLTACKPDQVAYWSDRYSLADLTRADRSNARIQTDVVVNGKHVDAILDSGAPTSVISVWAAKNAGISPGQEGVQTVNSMTGLAGVPIETWVGTFGTLALGDESVRNVKLRIANLFSGVAYETTGSHIAKQVEGLPEMLVGWDYFRTHRILVMFSERKLVFTYEGGPIFQTIERAKAPPTADGAAAASPGQP